VAALALSGTRDGSSGAATCDAWRRVESCLITRHPQANLLLAEQAAAGLCGSACPLPCVETQLSRVRELMSVGKLGLLRDLKFSWRSVLRLTFSGL
jgi:hypothetical protein